MHPLKDYNSGKGKKTPTEAIQDGKIVLKNILTPQLNESTLETEEEEKYWEAILSLNGMIEGKKTKEESFGDSGAPDFETNLEERFKHVKELLSKISSSDEKSEDFEINTPM